MARVFSDEGVKLVCLTALPTTPAALTATLVNAGKDLSDYAVVGQTDFVQAASDTNDEKAYSDKGKVSVPTYKNASGKGVFYRDRDVDGGLSTADIVSMFNNRQVVYFLKRKGVPEDTAWAAGQDYEYFKFQADYIATINDADGGYEKVEVGFNFQGDVGFGEIAS